jgi:hypothetical protein
MFAICHVHRWFLIGWNDWQMQLQSIVDVLHLLKAQTEAKEVQRIFDIVRFKKKGLVVKSQEFDIMA